MNIKNCPFCHEKIPEDAAFCHSCFSVLTSKVAPLTGQETSNRKKTIFPILALSLLFCVIAVTVIFTVSRANTSPAASPAIKESDESEATHKPTPSSEILPANVATPGVTPMATPLPGLPGNATITPTPVPGFESIFPDISLPVRTATPPTVIPGTSANPTNKPFVSTPNSAATNKPITTMPNPTATVTIVPMSTPTNTPIITQTIAPEPTPTVKPITVPSLPTGEYFTIASKNITAFKAGDYIKIRFSATDIPKGISLLTLDLCFKYNEAILTPVTSSFTSSCNELNAANPNVDWKLLHDVGNNGFLRITFLDDSDYYIGSGESGALWAELVFTAVADGNSEDLLIYSTKAEGLTSDLNEITGNGIAVYIK